VVRMRLHTESEPAITLEKVHAVGALLSRVAVSIIPPLKSIGVTSD
jgi:hypothetical protein